MSALPRIVMMGTGTFARPTFEALLESTGVEVVGLVTQPDRDGGSQRGSTRQTGASLKEMAVERGIPVFQPESVNTPEGITQLRAWQPDLLVVAAYGQILKKEILEAARWGGINVHGSLLPKFRGAAPVAHAILHGETSTGATIIRMTTGLDAGDMLAQESLNIGDDETAGELESRLAPLGARLAMQVIDELQRAGGVSSRRNKQDPTLVTKAPKLKKEDGLIDWWQPVDSVARQVRAMQPWPTAFTFLHQPGKPPLRAIVLRTAPYPEEAVAGTPGSAHMHDGKLLVVCGRGTLEILELQPAGKKAMSAAEFLRGRIIHVGDLFGPEKEPAP